MSRVAHHTRLFFDALDSWMHGKRIWLVVADVLVAGFLVVLLNYPLVKVTSVSVDGPEMWREEASGYAVPVGDSNLFHYDFESVGSQIHAAFGARALCDVDYEVPNGVVISLVPIDPTLWTDAGRGVSADGAIFATEVDMTSSPIWRPSYTRRDLHMQIEARLAAGVWTEVLDGDSRFEQGVSEWMRDGTRGWTMLAGDGLTRVILGWNNIEERAAAVARLLEQRDSTMIDGCTIDARFDGRLVVRPARRTASAQSAADNRRDSATMASRWPDRHNRQGG